MKWIWIRGMMLLVGIAVGGEPLHAQAIARMAKEAHPSFEVASIKLTDPEFRGQQMNSSGPRIKARGQTVTLLMMFAYGLHKTQIVGTPAWMNDVRYDINGLADAEGEPSVKQMQEMFRKLLTDRFGLAFHREQKEESYYSITVAKGGAKLVKSMAPADDNPDQTGNGGGQQQIMKFTNNSMTDFALCMQYFADKPVVDETALTGRYDFVLKYTKDDAPVEGDGPPGMFTAVQEQLGLKLEPKRGTVDVLVVDGVKRPSEN